MYRNDVDVRIYLVSNVGADEAVGIAYFRCARGDAKNVQSLGFSQTASQDDCGAKQVLHTKGVLLYPGTHGQTLGCLCALLFFVNTRCTCTPASSIVVHKRRRELTAVQDGAVEYRVAPLVASAFLKIHIFARNTLCVCTLTYDVPSDAGVWGTIRAFYPIV